MPELAPSLPRPTVAPWTTTPTPSLAQAPTVSAGSKRTAPTTLTTARAISLGGDDFRIVPASGTRSSHAMAIGRTWIRSSGSPSSSRTRLPRRPDPGRTDPHGLCRPTGRDRAALHSGASPLEPHSPDWVPPLDVHRSQSDLRLSLALRLPSSS